MKHSKADIQRMAQAYLTKFVEYEQMPLEELISLEKSNTIKGTYHDVLVNVIKLKQKSIIQLNEKEANQENKTTRTDG